MTRNIIVSVYAPTHKEVKDKFYDDLQTVIDNSWSSEDLLLLGQGAAMCTGVSTYSET